MSENQPMAATPFMPPISGRGSLASVGRSCRLQRNAATIQNRKESHETMQGGKDSRNFFFRPRDEHEPVGHERELASRSHEVFA